MQINILSDTVEPDEKMPLLLMKKFYGDNGRTWGINGRLKIFYAAPSKEEDIFATLNIFIQITSGSRNEKKFIKNFRLLLLKEKPPNVNIIDEVTKYLQDSLFTLFEEVSDYIGDGHSHHGNFGTDHIYKYSNEIFLDIMMTICQMKNSPYSYEDFQEHIFFATFVYKGFVQQKKILQQLSTQAIFNIVNNSPRIHLIVKANYISIYQIRLFHGGNIFILFSENPKMKSKYIMKINANVLVGDVHNCGHVSFKYPPEGWLNGRIEYLKSNVIKQAQRFNLENPPYRQMVIFEYN